MKVSDHFKTVLHKHPGREQPTCHARDVVNRPDSYRLLSSRIFFTIFTSPFHFLFPPLYPTSSPSFSSPTLMTNDKTIKYDILVHCGLAIRGGLRNNSTGCYIVPRTFENRSPIVCFLDEIPHRIKQVTLRRSLPGSQCLFFPLELEVHLSQPPRTQRARLKDDVHATTTDMDGTTI